jgi:tetratricopeptide (TPR) repeat protein
MSGKIIQSINGQHVQDVKLDHEKSGGGSICQEGVEVTSDAAQKVQFTVSKDYLALFEPELVKEDTEWTMKLDARAEDFMKKGDYENAAKHYENIIDIRQKSLCWGHPNAAITLSKLAEAYELSGHRQQAERRYKRTVELLQMEFGYDHPVVAAALYDLAFCYTPYPRPQHARAEELFRRSLTILETSLGPNHFYVAELVTRVADACNNQRDFDKAEAFYKRALSINEILFPPDHFNLAEPLQNLAYFYDCQGHDDQACAYYERALKINEDISGPITPIVMKCLENLVDVYRESKQEEKEENLTQQIDLLKSA